MNLIHTHIADNQVFINEGKGLALRHIAKDHDEAKAWLRDYIQTLDLKSKPIKLPAGQYN